VEGFSPSTSASAPSLRVFSHYAFDFLVTSLHGSIHNCFLPACLPACLPLPPPAGLSLETGQPWFYLTQRAAICHEFVRAMEGREGLSLPFGVLLSGPNGTGKSAIGLETAVTCFARGMVSVYISAASDWVKAAMKGNGDGFLLERLLLQNVDLIAENPILREVLAPALVLERKAVRDMRADAAGSITTHLQAALTFSSSLHVGLIVDEVQTISVAIGSGKHEKDATARREVADYFLQWHNWDNGNRCFVRMDIASSHGLRDLYLPSGEQHRLRIVSPWTDDLVTAATTATKSPLAFPVEYESARQRIVYTSGGIPRSLYDSKRFLDNALAAGEDMEFATSQAEESIKQAMRNTCLRWFEGLESVERQMAAAKLMLPLIRGEVVWDAVKGLYDSGIVARYSSRSFYVKPVSTAAASVIMAQLAPYYRKGAFKPLGSVVSGAQKGYELEVQVIVLLMEGVDKPLSAKTLQGNMLGSNVPAHAKESLTFTSASEVVAHPSNARLFVPISPQFACDAITVPPLSADVSFPIVLWETSVTSPHDSERIKKVRKWFRAVGTLSDKNKAQPAGIVTLLQAAHPRRPIVCALCWPENLMDAGNKLAYKELLKDAADASSNGPNVCISVVDVNGLQTLGVLA
jgi:hypothetical protein